MITPPVEELIAVDSDISIKGHFLRQRRNLVVISVIAILHQGKHLSLAFDCLKKQTEDNFYYVSALLLIGLFYLFIRYYQSMIVHKNYHLMKDEYKRFRDGMLRSRFNIHVGGFSGNILLPKIMSDKIKYVIVVKRNNDEVMEIRRASDGLQFTGFKETLLKAKYYLLSFNALIDFIFKHTSVFEFIFPLLLAFFATLELLGIDWGNGLVEMLANLILKTSSLSSSLD